MLVLLALLGALLHRAHGNPSALAQLRSARQARFASEAAAPPEIVPSPVVHGPTVKVALTPGAKPLALPSSFLGLSLESWWVRSLDSDPAALKRVLSLLRAPSDGDVMLRIGGESTEQTYWDAPNLGAGVDAYRPSTAWLDTLARMTRSNHLRVMIDLNLAADSASMAAAFAKALTAALPHGSIAAFEVGNEPDIGHRDIVDPLTPKASVPHTPRGWDEYTISQYISRFRSYARAVQEAVPGAPMAGPEIFYPGRDIDWIGQLLAAQRSRLRMLTVHRYPLSACTSSSSNDYATVARVLGQNASGGLANELVPAAQLAHDARLPLRLSEVNSVTCGGGKGVSNTFATALWAPDTLFSIWNVGVAGVNINEEPRAVNAIFSISRKGLTARPLLYGLIMFARALGPGAKLTPVTTTGASQPNVKVWAVRTRSGERKLLVLDKGSEGVHLSLALDMHKTATVERLTAPGVAATGGVKLAGQWLGSQGQWLGREREQRVTPSRRGTYAVAMPAGSGALITIPG